MYSTCIFCHSSLGRNDAVENFPVGRKLAFDANKGRLWAVCRKCGRWNLTPMEERWEAIEECEKLFRITRTRTSTDEIGLGRVREGTDLIRIGKPLRPEFAAWRYGKLMQSRARIMAVAGVIGAAGYAAAILTSTLALAPLILLPAAAIISTQQSQVRAARRYLVKRGRLISGRRLLDAKQIELRLIPTADEQGWGLRFFGFTMPVDLSGSEALSVLQKVMPAINTMGGFRGNVQKAVTEIESVGDPQHYFRHLADYARQNRMSYSPLQEFPARMRLATEMAAQEESERIAIVEGELKQLENDWREAEEIAAIADDLLLPHTVTEFIAKNRPAD